MRTALTPWPPFTGLLGEPLRRLKRWCGGTLLLLLTAAAPAWAEDLKIGGSGGTLGAMKLLADVYQQSHPDAHISVAPSLGSSGGIKAVLAGALGLGLSSRPLKDSEQAQGAVATAYARTPFVIATARDTSSSDISFAQLAEIYAGKTVAWPGGIPLRLVLRPAGESDNDILKSMSPQMDQAVSQALARKGMISATTDQDCADALEKITGAIGTTTLGLLLAEQRKLRALSLNGVEPSSKTIASGAYPYYKTLLLVSGANPSPLAREFMAFVRSPAGRAILVQNGHWVPNDQGEF